MTSYLKNLFYALMPTSMVTRKGHDEKTVYLTFDDGPYNECISKIYDVLCIFKVPATFFFNGDSINNYKGLIFEMHKKGYCIGNHSFSHHRPTHYNFLKSIKEIKQTKSIIEAITNTPCKIYRPPYGRIVLPDLFYAGYSGMKIVLWSYESRDSFVNSFAEIEKTLQHVNGGDILLFHNDSTITANNLHLIITKIQEKGLNFGLVTEL